MRKIRLAEEKFLKKNIPSFSVGDTVKVHVKVAEAGKTRLQAFEGVVIARKGFGLRESFTLRRISYGEGVERIFPLHSPFLAKVEVTKHGKTRRAKLYYLRRKVGRKTKVRERGLEPEEAAPETTDAPPAAHEAIEAEHPQAP